MATIVNKMAKRIFQLSLASRAVIIGLEAVADAFLLFVFLPSRLEGADAPSVQRATSPAALLASALVYGSQHLRFRGEWLLCALYGLALGGLTVLFDGQLLPTLVGQAGFAVYRHVMRVGLDTRRFHAQ